MSAMTIKMKDKEIIERKLEIFLKEHEESKERIERLGKIIETYASRYHELTGEYYIRNDLDAKGYYK
jgi:cell division septum initiation protein DivIVA